MSSKLMETTTQRHAGKRSRGHKAAAAANGQGKPRRKKRRSEKRDENGKPPAAVESKKEEKEPPAGGEVKKPKARRRKKMARARATVSEMGDGEDQHSFVKKLVKHMQVMCVQDNRPIRNVTAEAITMLDNLREFTVTAIIDTAQLLLRRTNGQTFSSALAAAALREAIPSTYTPTCIERANDARAKYQAWKAMALEKDERQQKHVTVEKRTGLFTKVSRTRRAVRKAGFKRVPMQAAVWLTASVEVILEVVVILTVRYMESVNPARFNKEGEPIGSMAMIAPKHVMNAVVNDKSGPTEHVNVGLGHFFNNVVWLECGAAVPEQWNNVEE